MEGRYRDGGFIHERISLCGHVGGSSICGEVQVSDPDFEDPVAFEKLLSRVEDSIAPLFKSINKQLRGPYRHEWESVFICIAVQWIRVPAFRPTLLRIADGIHQRFFAEALKTPESWAAWLKKLGVAADAPGAHYDRMVEFERGHQYTLSAEPEWFLYRGFKATEGIVSSLAGRYWRASVSSSGSFIGSDAPVSMDGAPMTIHGSRRLGIYDDSRQGRRGVRG